MTVRQLHETLCEVIAQGHGNDLVVQATDEEGNGFSETFQVARGQRYDAKNQEAGPAPDLEDRGVPAIILWP